MPPKKRRVNKKKKKHHIILILFLIIVGVFFLFEEFGQQDISRNILNIFKSDTVETETLLPETPFTRDLPKVALVIDDLGPNKKMAISVLVIDAPLTLSILPLEVYSAWIAEEGNKLGRDLIVHVPMEASKPLRLGNGGLYTWMTDKEISETLEKDILSVPHIIGASSHMGSAFTEDERSMKVVISELKKHKLFFLDSITTPKSTGHKIAKAQGIVTFKRDVFLDDSNDLRDIEIQWNRLVKIAQERGYAIAQGHARNNTIAFLEDTLRENDEVQVVPLSELMD